MATRTDYGVSEHASSMSLFSSPATMADKPSCACRQREYKKLQMYSTRSESGEYGVSGEASSNASLHADDGAR